ncbi:MAG: SIR2 family protein [Candidatus Thiodiazotropha endolucinida]|nr:SIR2 family protein [Candidatus Thiodiazotropha endolucinida]
MIPNQLRRRVELGQCVAFVGAGFSAVAGMPSWGQLINRLLESARDAQVNESQSVLIEGAEIAIQHRNYSMAVKQIEQVMNPADLDQAIAREFSMDIFHRSSQADQTRMIDRLKHLVSAPWAGIITTNYDELVEHGLGRFYTNGHPSRSEGNDVRLGKVLSKEAATDLFFVKLHGSIQGGKYVLGTEEYDRTYINTPQVGTFMRSLMMRYHLVFIGCSLEDEILRIRRSLCSDFSGHIPTAYALLADDVDNRARQHWLKESAQIESLLFDTESGGQPAYWAVDLFLAEMAKLARSGKSERSHGQGLSPISVKLLKAMAIDERISQIGQINLDLLQLINSFPDHAATQSQIDSIEEQHQIDLNTTLSSLSSAERFYRIMYLIAIGLLTELESADTGTLYSIPSEVVLALR